MEYLIYLPEDYDQTDKYYPTMYLLHQFSSSHTSYMVDGVNKMLDEAIADGQLDDLIVVIPNSDPNSWWKGKWEDMVINDLIPHIDANYRTIQAAIFDEDWVTLRRVSNEVLDMLKLPDTGDHSSLIFYALLLAGAEKLMPDSPKT